MGLERETGIRIRDSKMAESTKFWSMAPIILKMSKDPTNFYIGRPLWFSITFLYISVVYVVQNIWFDLVQDFQCHGNLSKACLAECYENHFTRPVFGVWYVVGFAFSSVFFVMEFFVSQSVHKQTKIFKKEHLEKKSINTNSNVDHMETNEDEIFDLSREKPLLAMYLVYFLTQLSIQVIFLAILIHYHLPLIKKPIWCSTHMCHGPYACVVLGTQEKMMSIILLATLSVVIMMFCIMFFLYTINTYLVMVRKSA
ncbi:gap junction beta-6 protein-like isoform X1 [Canis lupus familiaris]|uniref:gap junction beta-6 protein-like isoform X1 n=2 Tax=Canis lupus familiaris TaxID=9615 RepID=UPI0003AE658D|nr:gap junction beta-6 protein-like isoform X1 [Canis lupus familiaris]XP_025327777.1 gap junction beta-6 protein-like isoform X1 [Canis lupus dingo]XP_038293841.1 gap junction beta-6 protein-like isoform X1 [Canis lupus familiaris]XP_038432043.1 gap junction beta-6 protein-like isoform X1 [Canis lupus familiaris]|eukprot:XP_005637257.1 gap junction beta-6 protein-like isoform X1 [Canis lupus familiaris]